MTYLGHLRLSYISIIFDAKNNKYDSLFYLYEPPNVFYQLFFSCHLFVNVFFLFEQYLSMSKLS